MDNESFEKALEPQPIKRKRSSILKPADKRERRDSRTVSFNDRCIYKELHQDGTCDITNLFLRQDMDLSTMDIVSPVLVTGPASSTQNQTLNSTMDISSISADQVSIAMSIEGSNGSNLQQINNNNSRNNSNINNNSNTSVAMSIDGSISSKTDKTNNNDITMNTASTTSIQSNIHSSIHSMDMSQTQSINNSSIQSNLHSTIHSMDISLVSQFMETMPKVNSIDLPSVNYDASTIYEKKMSMTATEVSGISSLNSTLVERSADNSDLDETLKNDTSCASEATTLIGAARDGTTMIDNCVARISDISSLHNTTIGDKSLNDTLYGAFHDSNNISFQSRASGVDTLVHNIEALNECIQKVDQESEECRRKLDDEIDRLFQFYRHIVNKDNKYEFAISILGIRHSLWLIFNINPETYPNEKLNVKFAVNKKDKHLYPFPEFAEAVRRYTKEGRDRYLIRFVINAQKFKRFLRSIGFRKPIQ